MASDLLAGLFSDDTLFLLFLLLILFLLQNQTIFKKGVSTLNTKVSTVRTLIEAIQATLNALENVVEAPTGALQQLEQMQQG